MLKLKGFTIENPTDGSGVVIGITMMRPDGSTTIQKGVAGDNEGVTTTGLQTALLACVAAHQATEAKEIHFFLGKGADKVMKASGLPKKQCQLLTSTEKLEGYHGRELYFHCSSKWELIEDMWGAMQRLKPTNVVVKIIEQ